MKIVIETVDGEIYSDVILSAEELKRLEKNEIVDGHSVYKRRNVYLGIRLEGVWNFDENEDEDHE